MRAMIVYRRLENNFSILHLVYVIDVNRLVIRYVPPPTIHALAYCACADAITLLQAQPHLFRNSSAFAVNFYFVIGQDY